MVFFRLGRIEKAEKAAEVGSGESSQRGSSPVGASEAQNREPKEREKHEKKKKPKHNDDSDLTGSAGGSGPSSGEARGVGGGGAGGGVSGGGLSGSSGGGARSGAAGLSVNDFISKTKSQQRQGLKPSGPELIAYARYLGIDPVADHDLLWIAVEALEAPLPSDWTEHFDSNDRVFYYNATMRVSSWTHPLEHIYRETYKTIVNFRNANMSSQERGEKLHQLQVEVKQMELDVHKEIAQWTEHTDEQGNRFYFNREERQSTWTDPRPAKCQILYLRMKTLHLLASSNGGTQGFAENKGDVHGSRFAPLVGGSGFDDDPAFKRPKVGGGRAAGDGMGGGGGLFGQRQENWGYEDKKAQERENNSSPTSPNASDSDSDDERRKKKKKKKKEKKKRREGQGSAPPESDRHATAPPPRLGQNLRNSQSEPIVGGKPLLANVDEVRGGLGMQPSPAGPQSLSLSSFDHSSEGLSNVGRARVKAGIRLEPIGPAPGGVPTSSANRDRSPGGASGAMEGTPKGVGVRSSASVPALQL